MFYQKLIGGLKPTYGFLVLHVHDKLLIRIFGVFCSLVEDKVGNLVTLLNNIFIIYFVLVVHVEMKGKHGFLSASDWPLYPVIIQQF